MASLSISFYTQGLYSDFDVLRTYSAKALKRSMCSVLVQIGRSCYAGQNGSQDLVIGLQGYIKLAITMNFIQANLELN